MIKGLINKLKSQKGFTLLELLVVIAIIAILAAVIIVNLNSARTSANDAKVQSAVEGLSQAFTLYAAQNSPADLDTNGATQTVNTSDSRIARLTQAGILPEVPVHPASEGSYRYKSDIVGGEFKYAIWAELYSGNNNGKCFMALNNVTKIGECTEAQNYNVSN